VCDIAGYVVPVLQNGTLKWKKKPTGVRHDNARPRASGAVSEILEKYGWQVLPHPRYSPDMRPPDFDLFSKLKKPVRGKSFRSIEEVSIEVTRVIRRINNEGLLTGIQDLPKRWTAVIKHNGDYIEDL
jgi:histone-lysine N-methyltransferase SETMAR